MLPILIVILVLFGLYKFVYPWVRSLNQCEHCEGKGFWIGTRGEKNHCKTCDGTGRKK